MHDGWNSTYNFQHNLVRSVGAAGTRVYIIMVNSLLANLNGKKLCGILIIITEIQQQASGVVLVEIKQVSSQILSATGSQRAFTALAGGFT